MTKGALYENANHLIKVDYYKKGKPQGKRGNETYADTFLDVLHNSLLKELCEKVHGHDWWDDALNGEDIICNKENNVSAFYSIIFKNGNKVICEYEVEKEVIASLKEIINNPDASPNRKVD